MITKHDMDVLMALKKIGKELERANILKEQELLILKREELRQEENAEEMF